MSDSEDDFMSDKFLSGADNVRPGLAKTNHHRRVLKIEAERAEIEAEQLRKRMKQKPEHRERERREETLAKPIGEESKGFALMAKMGYKPGMSLGKKKDETDMGSGIKEPINIVFRNHKGGLGIDSAKEEKQQHEKSQAKWRIEAQMKRMKERASMTDELTEDYRKRARVASSQKQLIGDIIKSRKACHELDIRSDQELPDEPWFWPSYREKKEEDDDAGTSKINRYRQVQEEDDDARYIYSNGKEAPREEKLNELSEDELEQRLQLITCFLRSVHSYCVWCGCAFSDEEDLKGGCPGETRKDHDEDSS